MSILAPLFLLIVLALPIATALWSVTSMVKYQNRDKNDPNDCKKKKIMLVISTTIAVLFLLAIVGVVVYIALALRAFT